MIHIDLTPEQRRQARSGTIALTPEQARSVRANRKGGRPRRTDVLRCPCGAMTAARAAARWHKCEAEITAIRI